MDHIGPRSFLVVCMSVIGFLIPSVFFGYGFYFDLIGHFEY